MKKWLYVLLAIEIVSLIISFFAIITNSLLLAILIIPFGILGLMPLIALILCMENIEELDNFFIELGLFPKVKNGYYYPYSNQALSVKNALLSKLKESNVRNSNLENIIFVS